MHHLMGELPPSPLLSAQKHGLLCEVDSDDEDKELCEPFFAHCKAHSIKEVTKRKVMLSTGFCRIFATDLEHANTL